MPQYPRFSGTNWGGEIWEDKKRVLIERIQIPLQAAMPQLVPFFFVNEVVYAFIVLPTLIYLMSKYILPQKVRMMAARLFISKL